MTLNVPDSVDMFVHRIALHERYAVSPWEIRHRWTWLEVVEAHDVLNALESAEAEG